MLPVGIGHEMSPMLANGEREGLKRLTTTRKKTGHKPDKQDMATLMPERSCILGMGRLWDI